LVGYVCNSHCIVPVKIDFDGSNFGLKSDLNFTNKTDMIIFSI